MPYVSGQRVGKLRLILHELDLSLTDFHRVMVKQCAELGIRPITQAELVRISFGDKPDRFVSTYLKIVNALNVYTNGEFTLYDVIEPDEILINQVKRYKK